MKANGRLAELWQRYEWDDIRRTDMRYLLDRVVALEKLVPEAKLMDRLSVDAIESAGMFHRGSAHSAEKQCRADSQQAQRLYFAIREYEEGE